MTLPLLGIVGYSGTGKTTLLKKIIPLLSEQGMNVALIKHTHHDVDVDTPGKDSYELRKAGAKQTLIACDNRWTLITETPNSTINLYAMAKQFHQPDLILVEGFKHEPIPKIMLYRAALQKPINTLIDNHVIAVACDTPLSVNIPLLDINNVPQLVDFIVSFIKNNAGNIQ